ncbi:MAG TPA: hypothetical protein VEW71_04360 [Allosphingosinicella sp.]|nr:hypothetical protein [Allosphingosinicella sp.]
MATILLSGSMPPTLLLQGNQFEGATWPSSKSMKEQIRSACQEQGCRKNRASQYDTSSFRPEASQFC